MKNNEQNEFEFEKELRNKMKELSDSVDCIEKINQRVFNSKDVPFFEEGFVVSDLENITGKSHTPKLLKLVALAAVSVFCISFIPSSGVVQRFFYDFGGSVKKNFQNIITEIETETSVHDYRTMDIPLSCYAENDILITPFFSCPFEKSNKSGINVRIYIRQTGAGQYGGFDMAQVYAVEYTGEYCADNIIAAAQSAYTFTDKDLDNVEFSASDDDMVTDTVAANFSVSENGAYLCDSEGNAVSVASFSSGCYFKADGKTKYLCSDIIYWHNDNENVPTYFYDMTDPFNDKEHVFNSDARRQMWKESIYFNGNSAFPVKEYSHFTEKDIFDNVSSENLNYDNFNYIYAFDPMATDKNIETGGVLELRHSDNRQTLSTIDVPYSIDLMRSLKPYFSAGSFTSNTHGVTEVYNGETLRRVDSGEFVLKPKENASY